MMTSSAEAPRPDTTEDVDDSPSYDRHCLHDHDALDDGDESSPLANSVDFVTTATANEEHPHSSALAVLSVTSIVSALSRHYEDDGRPLSSPPELAESSTSTIDSSCDKGNFARYFAPPTKPADTVDDTLPMPPSDGDKVSAGRRVPALHSHHHQWCCWVRPFPRSKLWKNTFNVRARSPGRPI